MGSVFGEHEETNQKVNLFPNISILRFCPYHADELCQRDLELHGHSFRSVQGRPDEVVIALF